MKRMPRRWWRGVHLTSFGVFWLATIHGVTAGADASNPLMWISYLTVAGVVLFLTLVRVLADKRGPTRPRPVSAGTSAV